MELIRKYAPHTKRIRFSVSGLYRNELLAKRLEKKLSLKSGILSVTASPMTGNIIITFDESLKVEDIKKEIYKIKFNIRDTKDNFPIKQQAQYPWHIMTKKQIEKVLNTDIDSGLSTVEAKKRLNTYGLNQLINGNKPSFFRMMLNQVNNYLFKILLFAGGISFLIGDVADSIVIISIVVIESSLGVLQEYNAEKSLESLHKLTSPRSSVLRDGKISLLSSSELVPGDVVIVNPGDIVPADARIVECKNLETDESCLTGESHPSSKHDLVILKDDIPLAERKNMAYLGTSITKGYGKLIVVSTGMSTEIGKIAKMLNEERNTSSPLNKSLEILGKNITIAIIAISFSIFLSGIIRGKSFSQMLGIGISLAIGAIPEGLSTIVTIALAYGVQRMAKRNAIVRKLNSVETLGVANVICTDKTGTLTKNEMTVKEIRTLDKVWTISGIGYTPIGSFYRDNVKINPKDDKDLYSILQYSAMCCNSKLIKKGNDWAVSGDPTEGAIIVAASKAGIESKEYERIDEIPFDSSSKFMTVVIDAVSCKLAISKGAPDVILNKCSYFLRAGKAIKLGKINKNKLIKHNNEMSNKALRVLAVSYKILNDEDNNVDSDFIFAGLIGMEDPPKDEVKNTIEECLKNGINVVMITGDQKNTAMSIGERIGLLKDKKAISGQELDKMNDNELINLIDDVNIFYRTSPHHKLKIVRALRKKGYIVAMTGDGINDAPAVKEANIGIAMGKGGTDVTRNASDITLADDNFTTIVMAIKEGRGINENIKKFLRYVLSGNVGEIIALAMASMTGMDMPLTSSQILSINLVTEGIPALALGVEPSALKLKKNENTQLLDNKLYNYILTRGSLIGFTTLFAFKYGETFRNPVIAKTMAYSNLVMAQMFNVFDARRAEMPTPISQNKLLLPSVTISIATLLATIYINPIANIFGNAKLNLMDWFIVLVSSGLISRI